MKMLLRLFNDCGQFGERGLNRYLELIGNMKHHLEFRMQFLPTELQG